ncbi:MAG: DUF723 domain-containing protein, partial [Acidobacteria bacterium]
MLRVDPFSHSNLSHLSGTNQPATVPCPFHKLLRLRSP